MNKEFKICSRSTCWLVNQKQPLENFHKRKSSKDGFRSECKKCSYEENKLYKEKNKEKTDKYKKEYYRKNKIKLNNKSRKNYTDNKEHYLKLEKVKHEKNKKVNILKLDIEIFDGTLKRCFKCKQEKPRTRQNWVRANIQIDGVSNLCKCCYNKYLLTKKSQDLNFKIRTNLRKRLCMAIFENYKSGSSVDDLGCSIDELKQHLKSKFYPNSRTSEQMSWDNYGRKGWHVDHVIPLCSFDLTDREQFLKACHYSNLQPLWAEENMRKNGKYDGKL